ncbi:DUF3310 domain-containing protein [Konateibacter massiliensis]|uniref:DUF3310 domain-containing protein n=1 Tax=Konateibacter massiliensis TaxID=2002841 RepID=UPI000C1616F8|nr:DUF3310 domain-containing protein [Konateibacter massiliensis]
MTKEELDILDAVSWKDMNDRDPQDIKICQTEKNYDVVNSPSHYTDTKIEVIEYIEDKQLGFCLGNVIKYISRAGRKHSADKSDKEKAIEDLKKAKWYLDRRIFEIENDINV